MAERERSATNEKGFIKEGCYALVFVPAYNSVLAYRVISQRNKDYDTINFGELPGGNVAANSLTAVYTLGWPDTRVEAAKQENMFYYEEDDTLFQVFLDVRPIFLRNFIECPEGTRQVRFSDGDATVNPEDDDFFGYWRREKEFFFLPELEYNMRSYNDINVGLRTHVDIKYAEYEVELIEDPSIMKELWLEKRPVEKPVKRHSSLLHLPVSQFEDTLDVYNLTMDKFARGKFSVPEFMKEAI